MVVKQTQEGRIPLLKKFVDELHDSIDWRRRGEDFKTTKLKSYFFYYLFSNSDAMKYR